MSLGLLFIFSDIYLIVRPMKSFSAIKTNKKCKHLSNFSAVILVVSHITLEPFVRMFKNVCDAVIYWQANYSIDFPCLRQLFFYLNILHSEMTSLRTSIRTGKNYYSVMCSNCVWWYKFEWLLLVYLKTALASNGMENLLRLTWRQHAGVRLKNLRKTATNLSRYTWSPVEIQARYLPKYLDVHI